MLHAGPVGQAPPVEDSLAVVVGGVAAQAELRQQLDQPVVAGPHPLAAQIEPQAGGAGVAVHATAPAVAGLQQPHRQALALQLAGTDQTRETRSHHNYVQG